MSDVYRMCVLERAWVLAGRVKDESEFLVLDNVNVVRVWGTDAGIGQLNNGIRPETMLDPIPGEVVINPDMLIYSFNIKTWDPPPPPVRPKGDALSRIFVLNRAWVLSGNVLDMNQKSVQTLGTDVVRLWGTQRGIGQLTEGPTADTKLDPIPPLVHINMRHVIFHFQADQWPDRGAAGFGEYIQAQYKHPDEKLRALAEINNRRIAAGLPPVSPEELDG